VLRLTTCCTTVSFSRFKPETSTRIVKRRRTTIAARMASDCIVHNVHR
jgi:hypothetical protein